MFVTASYLSALKRHREACMLCARVERKQGRSGKAQQLVLRARAVNRDILFYRSLGV